MSAIAVAVAAVGVAGAVASAEAQKSAAGKAAKAAAQAKSEANKRLDDANEQSQAWLDPYANAGISAQDQLLYRMGLGSPGGGDLNNPYTLEQYKQDPGYTPMVNDLYSLQQTPGYQFELQQGQQALDNSAAARGSFLSGKQLKATQEYSQGVASTKYHQAWERAQNAYQAAFNRNLQNRTTAYDMLSGVANRGFNAADSKARYNTSSASQTGQNTMENGRQQADAQMIKGQANANMYTGIANSLQSGIGYYKANAGGGDGIVDGGSVSLMQNTQAPQGMGQTASWGANMYPRRISYN